MLYLKYKTPTEFTVLFETSAVSLYDHFRAITNIGNDDIYFIRNGKRVNIDDVLPKESIVHLVPKLLGGKGGFGSMLRAIGAQIEKTTNREACRDLSGRRLRDINEEKRLKTWIAQQVDREKEAADRRRKRLERMCEMPKHEFNDESYYRQQSEWCERVEESLVQGLEATPSESSILKHKMASSSKSTNKRIKLWIDDDLEDSDDSTGGDSDDATGEDSEETKATTQNSSNEEPSKEETVPENEETPLK